MLSSGLAEKGDCHHTTILLSVLAVSLLSSSVMNSDKVIALAMATV